MQKLLAVFITLVGLSANAGQQIKSKNLDSNYAVLHDSEQIDSMQKEIQSLNARLERMQRQIAEMQRLVIGEAEQKPQSEDEMVEAKPEPEPKEEKSAEPPEKKVAKGAEKQQYDMALLALKENDVKGAAQKFEEFIEANPKSALLGNAYFWFGETYYRQKIYDKSALQFLKSYKASNKGGKASDSLFKLAQSLAHLGKDVDSCSMLKKLDKEFPKRTEISKKKTEALRSQLKCK